MHGRARCEAPLSPYGAPRPTGTRACRHGGPFSSTRPSLRGLHTAARPAIRRRAGAVSASRAQREGSLISWPGLEATEHFRTGKTYRERDVWELHLLRVLVEQAGLIRSGGLWYELTPLGRAMLEPERRGTLQALLFRHAFWDMALSRFVHVHPSGLPGWWPQGEIGVILWGLSAVAEDWQNEAALTALCSIPDDAIPETRRRPASTLYPLDKRAHAAAPRRRTGHGNDDGGANGGGEHEPAPLLRRILHDQAATGLPALWLPHTEPTHPGEDEPHGDPS